MATTTLRAMQAVGWALGLGLASAASAQTVAIDFELDDQRASQLGLDVNAVESELNQLVSSELKLGEVQTFMDAMADANAMSVKGMGVDYASNPQKVVFGGAVGSAVNSAGFRFGKGKETLPNGGFAAAVSLMGGVNLGGIFGAKKKSPARRFLLYANGLAMPMPSGREFGGMMYNAGAHLQIRVISPANAKVVEWGGLAVTGGFERSTYVLDLRRELPLAAPLSGVDLAWTADGTYSISSTTDAIPLELSTNLRILVVTLFGGGAVDLNTGSSTSEATLGGPIEASAEGETLQLGTATVSVAADGIADDLVPRLFFGAQANVLMVKAYGQINVGLNDSVGGHVGARIAF